MRAFLLAPLLLSGCSLFAAHDGTYLVTLEMKSNSCDPESTQIGQETQMLASMYRTGESLVLELSGILLVGPPAEGDAFEVSYESGYSTSYDGCESTSESQAIDVEGTFSADLGFEGNATVSSRDVQVECPDDEEQICTTKYDVTAVRLNAATDIRPTGNIAWGYFPSGGY